MLCELCDKEFTLIKKQGGNNRKSCYDCIPEGMPRAERNRLRGAILTEKARREKELLGCSICGYNKYGGALEWHHENDDKDLDPASCLHRSWESYQVEISKCILVCANCHRELHK